jgi:hypothetical protein
MAIDTADKRFSMIGLTSPTVRRMKLPTGTIDAPARAMLLFLYSGIALAPPVIATFVRRTWFGEAGSRRKLPNSQW